MAGAFFTVYGYGPVRVGSASATEREPVLLGGATRTEDNTLRLTTQDATVKRQWGPWSALFSDDEYERFRLIVTGRLVQCAGAGVGRSTERVPTLYRACLVTVTAAGYQKDERAPSRFWRVATLTVDEA